MGGEGEKEALESNRFSASPSLIPQLRFIRVSELRLSVGLKPKKSITHFFENCFAKNYEKDKDFRENISENFEKIVKFEDGSVKLISIFAKIGTEMFGRSSQNF
jgi:hypothetical protein